jgi:SmpA / OmlA family
MTEKLARQLSRRQKVWLGLFTGLLAVVLICLFRLQQQDSRERIKLLKNGMTQAQVVKIMGTPDIHAPAVLPREWDFEAPPNWRTERMQWGQGDAIVCAWFDRDGRVFDYGEPWNQGLAGPHKPSFIERLVAFFGIK